MRRLDTSGTTDQTAKFDENGCPTSEGEFGYGDTGGTTAPDTAAEVEDGNEPPSIQVARW